VNGVGSDILPSERFLLTPSEFAEIFGRPTRWVYRQIESETIETIVKNNRRMIPCSEVGRIVGQSSRSRSPR
jgi:hypothetical protein